MAKNVVAKIKLQIPAGQANPAPPVGPALGEHKVNIMDFCKKFNDATKNEEPGLIIPVEITVYQDRSFDFVLKQPGRYARSLLSPHAIRRRLHWWFLFSIGRVMAHDAALSLRGEKRFEGFSGINKLWQPEWYDG